MLMETPTPAARNTQVALPETDVVPGAPLVTRFDQLTDPGEPVSLVQPNARLVGQRDDGDHAVESFTAQAVQQFDVQRITHAAALSRRVDINGDLGGPLIGGPIVPRRRVCHADDPVVDSYQPGEPRVQSSPGITPLVEALRLGPKIDDRVLDEVVDDPADLRQVILGGEPAATVMAGSPSLRHLGQGTDRCLSVPSIPRAAYLLQ